MSKLRVAVVGTGYLGRFHAEKYRALENIGPRDARGIELIGVCDIDPDRGRSVAEALKTTFFPDHRLLAGKVDAVTIAANTPAHFELARFLLEHGVHVLVEKPITRTSREAALLAELADRRGLKLQVGHVERFNPALISVRQSLTAVQFIECHRLAPFRVRGADVNVVLDLMIHDLDVILSLIDAAPTDVSAVGISVLTENVDIANARIEFANRAIANVTASRVSNTAQRKFRVFQHNQYVSIDFGNGDVRRVTSATAYAPDPAYRPHDAERLANVRREIQVLSGATADTARAGAGQAEPTEQPVLQEERWSLDKGDALLDETRAFIDAIHNDTPCVVSGYDGLAALELAERIIDDIERRAGGRLSWG